MTTTTETAHHDSVCQTAFDARRCKCSTLQHYPHLLGSSSSLPYSPNTTQQQTPLVHWGYATRMQCMWDRLSASLRTLLCNDEKMNRRVQLILLGPGLDRLGFRLLSEFPSQTIESLLEIDLEPICHYKRNELLREVANQDTATTTHLSIDWTDAAPSEQAQARQPATTTTLSSHHSNKTTTSSRVVLCGSYNQTPYTLVALDLNHGDAASVLDEHLAPPVVDASPSSPLILVVSELVVSYLSPPACQSLISYFGGRSNCSMLLYEVLGAPSSPMEEEEEITTDQQQGANNITAESAAASVSVAGNYRSFYQDNFRARLHRGAATSPAGSRLHPIGTSATAIETRFRTAGFDGEVHASTDLFSAAGCCTQLMDEHAAMALHLQTYVVVTASHRPWSPLARWFQTALQYGENGVRAVPNQQQENVFASYYVTPALCSDASPLREAFVATYAAHTKAYSSIRKMMKTVLQTDLAGNDVARYYRGLGGNYWVCVCASGDTPQCEVVGGLGVRRRAVADVMPSMLSDSSCRLLPCYEIQRVFVSDGHRGQGLGSALLDTALQAIRCDLDEGCHQRANVVAVTLSILDAANHFYLAHGFREVAREDTADLTFITYVREMDWSDSTS